MCGLLCCSIFLFLFSLFLCAGPALPSANTHDLAILQYSLPSTLKLNIEPYIRLRLGVVATVYLR